MNLMRHAADCVQQARALHDDFRGDLSRMPAEVAAKIDQLLSEAERCRKTADLGVRMNTLDADLKAPVPSVGAGAFGGVDAWRGIDATAPGAYGAKDLAHAERLGAADSVTDWCAAKGLGDGELEDGVSAEQAWGAWFKGYVSGDWREWREATKGRKDMLEGTDADGGVLVPTVLSGQVIDRLRAASPLTRMGATTVPMDSSKVEIARVAADAEPAGWHAEAEPIAASQVGLEKVTFAAKTLPVLVRASRELAEDTTNAGQVVSDSIAAATGLEVTRAALLGDGSDNSPTGVRHQNGVALTDAAGAADWATVARAIGDIRARDDDPNAYLCAPRTRTALELQTDAQGQYLRPPDSVLALDNYTSTVIPTGDGDAGNETSMYVANWRRLLIGMRVQMRIVPLRERYADTGEVAWLSWLRMDVQLEHPQSFQIITGITN